MRGTARQILKLTIVLAVRWGQFNEPSRCVLRNSAGLRTQKSLTPGHETGVADIPVSAKGGRAQPTTGLLIDQLLPLGLVTSCSLCCHLGCLLGRRGCKNNGELQGTEGRP